MFSVHWETAGSKKLKKKKAKREMEGREGIPIRGEMNEIETGGKAGRKRRKREEKSVTLIKHGICQLHALLSRPGAKLFPARVQSLVRIDVLLLSSDWVPCERQHRGRNSISGSLFSFANTVQIQNKSPTHHLYIH